MHMDYMFFEKEKQGEGEEEYKKRAGSPAIVIVDNRNGLIAAAFVPAKTMQSGWPNDTSKNWVTRK